MAEQARMGDGGTRDYDVRLRLCLADPIADGDLATLAEQMLEAVDTYAKSCVDGPAVGYVFEPPEVRLDFTTQAEDRAEVDRVIERVREIISAETSMQFRLDKYMEPVSA